MSGMWELPSVPQNPSLATPSQDRPLIVLRHAIMQTNYCVAVIPFPAKTSTLFKAAAKQCWMKLTDLHTLPLTGLARKVFLRLGMLHTPPPGTKQLESSRAFDESLVTELFGKARQ
jgi:hypothetical protein